jgi:hypothetical protein
MKGWLRMVSWWIMVSWLRMVKYMVEKIFCVILLCGLCSAAFAQQHRRFKEGDFEFYLEGAANAVEERAVITGYTGGDSISIPGSLGSAAVGRNVRVGRVAADAFKGKGAISVDLNIAGMTVDNGAFADNPDIERITIAENLSLAPRAFDKNFPAYYNTTRGKAAGTYRYSMLSSKWMTNEEWITEQARLRSEAQKPPPPSPPSPPPSYSYYSGSDIDFDAHVLCGWFLMAGYLDYFAGGLNLQAGFGISADDFAIDLFGYLDGGVSCLFLPTWGLGLIGEMRFDDFGLGFGTGLAATLMELLNSNTGGSHDDKQTGYYKHRQYVRGALIFFDSDMFEADKLTLYADYFLNSNWRFGITFHWDLL